LGFFSFSTQECGNRALFLLLSSSSLGRLRERLKPQSACRSSLSLSLSLHIVFRFLFCPFFFSFFSFLKNKIFWLLGISFSLLFCPVIFRASAAMAGRVLVAS
jgi:hypothetical protein